MNKLFLDSSFRNEFVLLDSYRATMFYVEYIVNYENWKIKNKPYLKSLSIVSKMLGKC